MFFWEIVEFQAKRLLRFTARVLIEAAVMAATLAVITIGIYFLLTAISQ